MEAGKRTISDIFNGNRLLEIPFFQRSYVWTEDQWERLISDMELITIEKKPFFLGSIILKQLETSTDSIVGDRRTIVDGQQRLTSLCIFFKVLCLKNNANQTFDRAFRLINNNDRISIEHNHNDIESFNKILALNDLQSLEGANSLIKAYNYFNENINTAKIDFQIVFSKIMFVVIDLGTEEDEQQIFDTINSLGVRLTTAELLKNYFFGRKNIDSYIENWKNVFEKNEEVKSYWDREITAGRLKRDNIDLFFYSYLQIKIQEENLKVKAEDKKIFSKVEGLFDNYKTFISKYKLNKNDLIKEIKEYALIYFKNIDPLIPENELTNDFGIERLNAIIFGLDNSTLIPYVLYILKNVTDQISKNKIFEYLESYLMRRIICQATNKNYNRLFSEQLILNKALTLDILKDIIEKKADKANYFPTDDEISLSIKTSILTNKQAAGLLYMIESKIRDRQKQSTALLGLNKYSLEHMMPKKWENNWGQLPLIEQKIKRDRKLLTLGNLTIITCSLNSSIRDADWATKKNGRPGKHGLICYSAGIETVSNFLLSTVWDETKIDERAAYLETEILKIWKN